MDRPWWVIPSETTLLKNRPPSLRPSFGPRVFFFFSAHFFDVDDDSRFFSLSDNGVVSCPRLSLFRF